MKLCLLSAILVLVPLALAALPPPAAKFLYQSGDPFEMVITEMNDAVKASYSFNYNGSELNFRAAVDNTRLPDSSVWDLIHLMRIKGESGKIREQNLNFAIEVYPNEKGYRPDATFCKENSEPHLRGLIVEYFSRIVLRSLTANEEKELTKVRSGPPNYFEITYDKDQVSTKSTLLNSFKVEKVSKSGFGANPHFNVTTFDHVGRERGMSLTDPTLAKRSFVINALSANSYDDCYETELKDLKVSHCKGPIQLAPLSESD